MANAYDMSWGDVGVSPTPYFKLDAGRQGNRLRVVSKPSKVLLHWEKDGDGKLKKIVCPDTNCPICAAGNKPQVRYALLVLDKKGWTKENGYGEEGPKVKLLETGITVVRGIKDLAVSPLYGDPSKYDLLIKKEGSGRDTKYTVLADPEKSELTAEEKEAISDAQHVSDIEKESSAEEILAMNLACLGGTASEVGSAPAAAPAAKGGNATTADDDWNSF